MAGDSRPLDGRVAVVTGVGRRAGIGYAIARRLLESGAAVLTQAWTPYDVASWDAEPGEGDAVSAELKKLGRIESVQADFAEPDAPAEVFAAAPAALGTSTSSWSTTRAAATARWPISRQSIWTTSCTRTCAPRCCW